MLNSKHFTGQFSRFMSIMKQKSWDLFRNFDFGEDVLAEIYGFDNASDQDLHTLDKNLTWVYFPSAWFLKNL